MTYKSDREQVEDAIFPSLLKELIRIHIKQGSSSDRFTFALELLNDYIKIEDRLLRRVKRIELKIIDYMESQGWEIRKAYMVISHLAAALYDSGNIYLQEGTKRVVADISKTISSNYNNEDVKTQDISAAKQVPKILLLLQEEGLF